MARRRKNPLALRRNPPITWIILILGGAAAVMVFLASRTTLAKSTAGRVVSAGSGAVATAIGWITKSRAVVMLPAQSAFMARMRSLVPASIPLMVTSGYRSPADQAAADASKINRGETLAQLSRLYGNNALIREMIAAPMSSWTAVLQAQVARGQYLSSHMRGNAIDLRIKGLSSSDVAAMVAGAKAAGARQAFAEATGSGPADHVHVTIS